MHECVDTEDILGTNSHMYTGDTGISFGTVVMTQISNILFTSVQKPNYS